MPSTAKS